MDFEQSRAWWYHWFMSVDRGAAAAAKAPNGFARIQWESYQLILLSPTAEVPIETGRRIWNYKSAALRDTHKAEL